MHQRGIMPESYHMDLRLKAIRMAEDGIGKSKIYKFRVRITINRFSIKP